MNSRHAIGKSSEVANIMTNITNLIYMCVSINDFVAAWDSNLMRYGKRKIEIFPRFLFIMTVNYLAFVSIYLFFVTRS